MAGGQSGKIPIACPGCRNAGTAPASLAGKTATCPKCGFKFTAPGPAGKGPAPVAGESNTVRAAPPAPFEWSDLDRPSPPVRQGPPRQAPRPAPPTRPARPARPAGPPSPPKPPAIVGLAALVVVLLGCCGILGVLRDHRSSSGPHAHERAATERQRLLEAVNRVQFREGNRRVILNVAVDGNRAIFQVDNAWHLAPYQFRLQAAQGLHAKWVAIHSPGKPDDARIRIVDLVGNEVGGTSAFSGVWVQK